MNYNVIDTPAFGILITLIIFNISRYLQMKSKIALLNPVLVSVIFIISFLSITKIPYEKYVSGANAISYLLGPVTVVLAIPLHRQFHIFKKNFKEIFIGIITGVITTFITVFVFVKITNSSVEIMYSLFPKSITLPMGLPLAIGINGIEAITIVTIVFTGITGAVVAPLVFKFGKIKHSVAKGIALGTASHVIGTSKAVEMGEIEGAMSSLSIGVSGIITVILLPIILKFFM